MSLPRPDRWATFNLISSAPPEADDRSEVGHLEGDLITRVVQPRPRS